MASVNLGLPVERKRCSAATYRMDLRVCGSVRPLGLEWTQCILLSRSRCDGLRSSPAPAVGASGAMRPKGGSSRRSWRAATHCVPCLDGMDCRFSNCLDGGVSCEKPRPSFRSGRSAVCAGGAGRRGAGANNSSVAQSGAQEIAGSSRSKSTASRSGPVVVRTRQ